jgi:hypothetical protein
MADRGEPSYTRRLLSLPAETRLFLLAAAAEPVGDPVTVHRSCDSRGAATAVVGGFGGLAIGLFAAYGVVPPQPIVIATLVLSGVALGALPLVISIIPAEAVASGDVGRSLLWPIATGEVIGAAALPAVAAAAAVGEMLKPPLVLSPAALASPGVSPRGPLPAVAECWTVPDVGL